MAGDKYFLLSAHHAAEKALRSSTKKIIVSRESVSPREIVVYAA